MSNKNLKLTHYLSKNSSSYNEINPTKYRDFFELSDTGLVPGKNIVSIKVTKGENIASHNINININNNSRNRLVFSKVDYDTKYNNLVNIITEIFNKGTVTEEDSIRLSNAFDEYANGLSEYHCAFADALDEIAESKVSALSKQLDSKFGQLSITAEEVNSKVEKVEALTGSIQGDIQDINANVLDAKSKAETASKTANDASKKATDASKEAEKANKLFVDLASDNKITSSEKQSTKLEWDKIALEKPTICGQALEFEVSYFDYENKYNELKDYIEPILIDLSITTQIVGTDFRLKFSKYYDERQKLLNNITKKAKDIADQANKKVSDLEANVTIIGEKLTKAEEKITNDSIINTVTQSVKYKSDIDSKANKDNVFTIAEIEAKEYASSSEVEQLVNKVKMTFEESGGYNILLNSDGSNGTKFWKGTNGATLGNNYDNNLLAPTGAEQCITISTSSSNEGYCNSDRFKLKPGKKYSISGWYLIENNSKGIDIFILGSDTISSNPSNETYAYDWVKNIVSSSTNTNGKFVHFHGVFETPASCKTAFLRVDNNGSNNGKTSRVMFTRLMGTEGEYEYLWSSSPNEIYTGVTSIDKAGVSVTASVCDAKTSMSFDGFKITKISTGEDIFKVKEDGTLYFKGECILEGSSTTGESGRKLLIENAIYSMFDGSTRKGIIGFRNIINDGLNTVPRLALGADGLGSNQSYFVVTPYPENNNPGGRATAYVDIAYKSKVLNDWSNLKMFDDGVVRVAALKELEITSNYVKGSYAGGAERSLALFTSTNSKYYDANLQVPVVRNLTNGYGLILTDDHATNKCAVRVNVDSEGARFFRPLTDDANVELGSYGFKWKKVHSLNGVGYSVVDNSILKRSSIIDESVNNVLETLNFDMNIQREKTSSSSDIQFTLDISSLKNHPLSNMFLDVVEEINDTTNEKNTHISADMTSLLHLALYELQKCKSQITELTNKVNSLSKTQ